MIEAHKVTINPFFLSEAEQISLHVLAEILHHRVNRMKFNVFLKPQHITRTTVKPPDEIEPTLKNILEEVAKYFKVSITDLVDKSRKGHFVKPRQIYYRIAREKTDCKLWQIGILLNRDHATAYNGAKSFEGYKYKKSDPAWSDYLKIKSMFK